MANTRCQSECEAWIRHNWLEEQFGQTFTEANVILSSGGTFRFDAVSEDRSIIASISTSKAAMSSGRPGVGKFMKLRADMLFHVLSTATRKLMIFTEECMYQACIRERERGRTPRDIEFVLVTLPAELAIRLARPRRVFARSAAWERHQARNGLTIG
jgi:hypothetical protein